MCHIDASPTIETFTVRHPGNWYTGNKFFQTLFAMLRDSRFSSTSMSTLMQAFGSTGTAAWGATQGMCFRLIERLT